MYKLVIDTNVFVSALLSKNSKSPPVRILDYLFEGKIIPLYNDEIFSEYENILRRLKFNFEDQEIKSVLKVIKLLGLETSRTPTKDFFVDTSDIVFYEIALTHRLENVFLVTGNLKHFPQKDFIVSPKDMLTLLDQKNNMKQAEEAFDLAPEYDFSGGIRGRFYNPQKVQTSIRLDNDIILYFKKKASKEKNGYQTLINNALREYINQSM